MGRRVYRDDPPNYVGVVRAEFLNLLLGRSCSRLAFNSAYHTLRLWEL